LKTWIKWLGLSAFITIICVFAGGFITRQLTERERDLQMKMGPHHHHVGIINDLVKSGKFSSEAAFEIVENHEDKGPESVSWLIPMVRSSSHFLTREKLSSDNVQKFELVDGNYIVYARKSHPPGPPPGVGFGGGPRMPHGPPPPPGVRLIGIVAITVSIIVGLGLSFLFFTIFIRKKSRQAEEVISRLKSGDLKARFKVSETDESNQLMLRFNDMAEQIEGLVTNFVKPRRRV
jgi:methyl-accepting chemotaxis protein